MSYKFASTINFTNDITRTDATYGEYMVIIPPPMLLITNPRGFILNVSGINNTLNNPVNIFVMVTFTGNATNLTLMSPVVEGGTIGIAQMNGTQLINAQNWGAITGIYTFTAGNFALYFGPTSPYSSRPYSISYTQYF